MKHLAARSAALVFCAGLLCGAPAFAQSDAPTTAPSQSDVPPPPPSGGPHRGGPEHRLEMLQHSLNLSTEQTAQVKTLLSAERAKMEALRSNTSLTGEDRHTQMMTIHEDTTTKMHGLLTADQAAKYDAMEERMRSHRRGGEEGTPPPAPADAPQNY